jgi:hypothetical protein
VEEIDRRTLLRRAGLLAGTGVVAGLAGCEPEPPSERAGGGAATAAGGWARRSAAASGRGPACWR